jgi:pyruvate/2-oxoglutarate/acetoin dehydrogenase E1 component/TPP-dependent pyruvate/acetoin dehydrogenase alpha subunit
MSDAQQFFAQLYAIPDVQLESSSAGRQMNGHYSTRWLDDDGNLKDLTKSKNSSSDISPTAGQMVRGLGLAFASKMFRKVKELQEFTTLSNNGNEVAFVTIGDASTSEGLFWETINAAGVMQVPLAIFVYDDGYGISVPKKYQTSKSSISEALAGFKHDEKLGGIDIYTIKGWDYVGLNNILGPAIQKIRDTHIPAVFHIQEITQPQGHSTSGSHERYKSKERLQWEKDWDCLKKLREYILEIGIITEEELSEIDVKAKEDTIAAKKFAWEKFLDPIQTQVKQLQEITQHIIVTAADKAPVITTLLTDISAIKEPIRKDILRTCALIMQQAPNGDAKQKLKQFYTALQADGQQKYGSGLHSTSEKNALQIPIVTATYSTDSKAMNGFEILNQFFDNKLATNPKIFAFGEDVGAIGDVNQGFSGLQEKHGGWRVFDTGIREATIMGQGMGMALRGLRPIAEIQYLDYLLYGLQPLSDDVATLQWRTKGGQKCPLIIRTRGHRLEGVWHSGSPMGMIINSVRGMYLCVPRNMVQAAGMYNTLLAADEPAIVVECLNGYRLKEAMPDNVNSFTVPLGIPEILQAGDDVTIVSYGSTLRIIQDAVDTYLTPQGISCEIIDVQTLLPFDINHSIVQSLKKTNRIVFVDEDVPSGAVAYMFQQVMELQGGFKYLDVAPRTIAAKAHRPAYGTDGDYFSKPNAEDITAVIEEMMAE